MLYHKHRSLNGQSSFVPPVTDLMQGALAHLPDDGARRILESVGARYLLVHAEDLDPSRRALPEQLAAEPEHYRRVFQQGAQSVFALSAADDAALDLADTPRLPVGARSVPASELGGAADLRPERARMAVDGDLRTFWAASRPQARGQYFEVALAHRRRIAAFEIDNPEHPTDVPLSFQLSVARGASDRQTVIGEPVLRVYKDQIYSPKAFVFRVVLPNPTWTDRIRITIADPVPGQQFVIQEARVYERP
jgi:hypothetical protein